MSDTKNRAVSGQRRAARVIKVAPVTLAIRAALAVSATTFAFSASAAGHIANPTVATSTTQHQGVHHFPAIQPVVDLTTVNATHLPSGVFDAPVAVHHSAGIATLGGVAAESESLGAVQDLVAIPTLTPGPGGVSGADNQIFVDLSGYTALNSSSGNFGGPTSTTGYADFVFASSDHFNGFTNNGDISATGATWAAGFELEADTYARDVRNSSLGTITTNATGDFGQAWGIYVTAVDDAHVYNDGTIYATASGKYGTATGLFGYSQTGAASASNTGTIIVDARGDFGQARGEYAAAYGDATVANSGVIHATAYGYAGTATGMAVYSANGNASTNNSGYVFAGAFGDATGIGGIAAVGDVDLTNTYADSTHPGSIDVFSYAGNAIGISGYAAAGDVDIHNGGSITAYSYYGLADGVFASGTSVSVTNTGDIYAAGYTWGAGIDAKGSDLTTVTNDGSIEAYSFARGGHAVGIYATGGLGGVTVDNTGPILAEGYYAAGISVVSDGPVNITNTGAITAYGLLSGGIQATTNYPGADIAVTNDGDIVAGGYYGGSGIDVSALGTGSSATVTNTATLIHAEQMGNYGYGSVGIVVSADASAGITNSGSIESISGGLATGLMALSVTGDANITNSGDVYVSSAADRNYGAYGLVASSASGTANVDNSGALTVYSDGYIAIGIQANSLAGTTVNNSNSILVDGYVGYGVYATTGDGDVAVTNGAAGRVTADGIAASFGVLGVSTNGNVVLDNAGDIQTTALGQSVGEFAFSSYGDVSVINSGTIQAMSKYDTAIGMIGRADYGDVLVDNSYRVAGISLFGDGVGVRGIGSTVEVTNTGEIYGIAMGGLATGIDVYGSSSASVVNDGLVGAMSKYGSAHGIYAVGDGDVSVTNGEYGEIDASASHGAAWGVIGYSIGGTTTVGNAGTITVLAQAGATGIYAGGVAGATVTNGGTIDVHSYDGSAIGVFGYSTGGVVDISNTGSISVVSDTYIADGIFASGATVDVNNSGPIDAMGYVWAAGIDVDSGGAITIVNTGSITAGDADATARASGIYAINNYEASDILVTNGGDIAVNGYYGATGIDVAANGAGSSASVTNTALISVNQSSKYGYGAAGIVVSADNNASIVNAGSITAVSAMGSYGAMALAFSGDANVVNSGDIDVTSTAFKYYSAVGMLSASSAGAAFADNSGNLHVTANTYLGTGIQVSGNTGATATNSGAISVEAKYAYGIVGTATNGDVTIGNSAPAKIDVYSAAGFAAGVLGIATVGDVSIDNAGSVSAIAYGVACGVFSQANDGNVTVTNSGSVYAYSYGDQATGVLAIAANGDVSVANSGSIDAVAYYGDAVGVYGADTNATSFLGNSGTISATGGTLGSAIGVLGAGYAASVSNAGSILATGIGEATGVLVDVYAHGALSNAAGGKVLAVAMLDAYGAFVTSYAGVASVDNAGLIDGTTSYAGGTAAGVYAAGYTGAQVTNSGTISAHSATGSNAIGVIARGNGPVVVENSGLITATDDDHAVAVSMDSATDTATLINTGVIRTYSTLEGEVAVQGGDGIQQVLNDGDIYGAIISAGGDDVFANGSAGTWHVTNHSTDFGDGDDTIDNAVGGTIELAFHGAIHLGASGPAGNAFINEGTIRVLGHGLIDMGASGSASNLLPLENNGIIDFVDGSTNDMLTILGDLGGTGGMNIDINPLTTSADQLVVNGNVTSPQAVFLNLAGTPLSAHIDPIVFAHVSGDSTAGSFVGGGLVGYDASSFLDLQVNVTSQIDASNAASDVFAIGLDVAGLNDAGSLGASITSSAQSIINSQVGTWRQRMGVLPQKRSNMLGVSPWVRFFSDNGTVNASHTSNFGGTGAFSYDQSTTGRELGMNLDFDNGLNTGLLLAKADGSEHLRGSGVGSDHIDSSTFGAYGTWISQRGFYVDASYRWIDLDAHLKSAGGFQSTSGSGEAFNVEAGYAAWTYDGVDIAPQLQYTHTKVDGLHAIHGSSVDFATDGGTSSRGRLGVAFSKTINDGGWIWTPYGSVNAVHEFDGESAYTIGNTFAGSTSTDGTSAMVELGLGAQKNGFSVTGGANWTDGGALQSFIGGQVVLRYTW